MMSEDFDPANSEDLKYIWHIWYSLFWCASTKARFSKDVKQLLKVDWSTLNHIVLDRKGVANMKRILSSWLKRLIILSTNKTVKQISKQR